MYEKRRVVLFYKSDMVSLKKGERDRVLIVCVESTISLYAVSGHFQWLICFRVFFKKKCHVCIVSR